MRALVTGAAGFIGSHLVDRLLYHRREVIGVDNYAAGNPDNLRGARDYRTFREVVADVRAVGSGLFDGVDIVYHQAAAKKLAGNPRRDVMVNAWGTLNVLSCAAKAGVKRFVYASTGSVYGLSEKRVGALPNPLSNYGVSKLAGEGYASLFNMELVVLRYFHVYGPRQSSMPTGGVVSIFLRRLLEGKPPVIFGTGRQTSSFTWVEDVVTANLIAEPGTHNVASGREISIQLLANMCQELVPGPGPLFEKWQEIEVERFEVDNSSLDIKWLPFEKGLERTASWLRGRYGHGM